MRKHLRFIAFTLSLVIGAYSASSAQMRVDGIPAILKIVTRALFADGSASAPSAANQGDENTGIFFPFADYLGVAAGGTHALSVNALGLEVGAAQYVAWADVAAGAGPTLALVRDATGILGVQSTSAALGALHVGYVVETNTGTKAPTLSESREVYNDNGDADGSIINLPNDPTAGYSTMVAAISGQTITVNTGAGETIWLAGTSCGTDITGADTGATLLIVAVVGGAGGVFHAIGSGTWTC